MIMPSLYKMMNVSRADYTPLLYGSSMNLQGGKMQCEIGYLSWEQTLSDQGNKRRQGREFDLKKRTLFTTTFSLVLGSPAGPFTEECYQISQADGGS